MVYQVYVIILSIRGKFFVHGVHSYVRGCNYIYLIINYRAHCPLIKMDTRSKHRTLSREEEAELSRSKKKVKDVHHVDFSEGVSENGLSTEQQCLGFAEQVFQGKIGRRNPRSLCSSI